VRLPGRSGAWSGLPLRRQPGYALVAGLGVLMALLALYLLLRPQLLPDFASIADMDARKEAFFAFLEPHIEAANRRIQADRARLEALLRQRARAPLNRREAAWLDLLAQDYRHEFDSPGRPDTAAIRELLLRVDRIPPSLALAQAALESGWGTSRFAREGNNLFGIWCYTPGCGIVPRNRPAGATYEVARYRSPRDCFLDYIRLLNSNPAYAPLWELRQQLRAEQLPVTGMLLADGLERYSDEGARYIAKVRSVIQSNGLEARDAR